MLRKAFLRKRDILGTMAALPTTRHATMTSFPWQGTLRVGTLIKYVEFEHTFHSTRRIVNGLSKGRDRIVRRG